MKKRGIPGFKSGLPREVTFDPRPEGRLRVRTEMPGQGEAEAGGGQRAFKVMEVTEDIKFNEGERK